MNIHYFSSSLTKKLVIGILFILFTGSCEKKQAQTATLGAGSVMDRDLLYCDTDLLPKKLNFGDRTQYELFKTLSPCQLRAMTILAEGASIRLTSPSDQNMRKMAKKLFSMTISYLKVPLKNVKVTPQFFDGKRWMVPTDELSKKVVLKNSLVYINEDFVYIPVHPHATQYHPLLKQLILLGEAMSSLPFELPPEYISSTKIATMSRSFWVFDENSNGLRTIKMGSNVVHGKHQDNKLLDVYKDVEDLEKLSKKTSISSLMKQEEILYIPDLYAVLIESMSPSESSTPYAISVRNYEKILQDRERIYISSHRLRLSTVDPTGLVTVPIQWDRDIIFSIADFNTIMEQLNEAMGKTVAIHHANGYMPVDFHGQNVMVGIPLMRDIGAKLVVRDVSDVYYTNFKKKLSCYPCLKLLTHEKWPLNVRESSAHAQTISYGMMMSKLDFMKNLVNWRQINHPSALNDLWKTTIESHQNQYWDDVRKTRKFNACQTH